jgi:dihydroorotate dehydrogenase
MLNLSCPNTDWGVDPFSDPGVVRELLGQLSDLHLGVPVFLKVAPCGVAGIELLLAAADPFPLVSGFMFNLPRGKPAGLRTPRAVWENLPGAVSGPPVRSGIAQLVRELYRRMDRDRYHIIAAGGVFGAEDAYHYIRQGASLVQLLTALIYDGPAIASRIQRGLARLLERDGLSGVAAAVGAAD